MTATGDARRRVRIGAGIGIGLALLTWLIGISWSNAVLLGVAAVVVYAFQHLPSTETGDLWPDRTDERTDTGARREVARLSWGLQGYENRVELSTLRRLRRIAAGRLAESGLDLDRAEDADRCRALLGDETFRLLAPTDPVRPLLSGFERAIVAVEHLTPHPTGARS